MKYYYTYKITCTEGSFKDKFYFGQHRTNNLDDGYKGSGKIILHYYKKYPNGYIKEILNFYDNEIDLNNAEYEIIKNYINDPNCLNLVDGGGHFQKGHIKSEETKKKISNKLKGRKIPIEQRKKHGRPGIPKPSPNEHTRNKISKSLKKYYETHPGQSNTPSTKGKPSTIRGKHRVYDNLEKTKYHFE